MKPISAVPMIALTRSQDNVEAINKALRNAGHPVHVTWLPDARDLGDALTQASAEMLMLFADEGIVDLASAMDFRARFAPDVPVLLVREKVDEAAGGADNSPLDTEPPAEREDAARRRREEGPPPTGFDQPQPGEEPPRP